VNVEIGRAPSALLPGIYPDRLELTRHMELKKAQVGQTVGFEIVLLAIAKMD